MGAAVLGDTGPDKFMTSTLPGGHDWLSVDFQAVILAGGSSKKLYPLTSPDLPKTLLPVGNQALLAYSLELLKANNFKHVLVVVAGEEEAHRIVSWMGDSYTDHLTVEVRHFPEDMDTADVLRSVAPRFTARDIIVLSGDIVSEIPLSAVAARHRAQGVTASVVLCQQPASTLEQSGKEKAQHPSVRDYVGLDSTNRHLLFLADAEDVGKGEVAVRKSILRSAGQMTLRMDLMDTHLYIFNREVLKTLEAQPAIKNIKRDLIPYLARTQLRSTDSAVEDSEPTGADIPMSLVRQMSHAAVRSPAGGLNVAAYVLEKNKYCMRVNSLQAYADVNRDVAGDAVHLTGLALSVNNNIVDPTAVTSQRTTIGAACIVGKGSQLGEKCSVKKSVIGRHCRIGNNVKITNSVLMNHVTVGDGCTVLNSIVSSNVQIQEKAGINNCFVGPYFLIGAGLEFKAESLAKK